MKATKVASNAKPERRVIKIVPILPIDVNPQIPKRKANPARPQAKIGVYVRNGVMRVRTDVKMYSYLLDVG